jgi:hypothetical protein
VLERLKRGAGVLGSAGPVRTIPSRDGQGPDRLSYSQERVWLIERLAEGQPIFNLFFLAPLPEGLDRAAVRSRLREMTGWSGVRSALTRVGFKDREMIMVVV